MNLQHLQFKNINGAVFHLKFDGDKVFQQTKSILQLNPISR